ncbi:hypothetical protein [Streptomyces sp. BBFR102]|uniref:hypothetical protein n=1 Tax=Streptomyces sp. BBFR102 TaxID=3448171 RepID=UPI003F5397B7
MGIAFVGWQRAPERWPLPSFSRCPSPASPRSVPARPRAPGPPWPRPSPLVWAGTLKPPIVTRAQWGADPELLDQKPHYADSVRAVVIHHTGHPNGYDCADSPALVREVYQAHAVNREWETAATTSSSTPAAPSTRAASAARTAP